MKQVVPVTCNGKVVGTAVYWFENDILNYEILSLPCNIYGTLSMSVTKDIEEINISVGIEK